MAIDEMSARPDMKFRTDLIGIAIQFSSQPKLKREDFKGMLEMTLIDVANELKIKV